MRAGTPERLSIAIVHLGFERTSSARDLIDRYPVLSEFARALAARDDLRVTVLARFWRDESFEDAGVSWHFRVDDPDRSLAAPWTRPRALYQLLDTLRPDVVQVNGFVFPGQVLALRWRLPKTTALIVRHHGEGPEWRRVRWTQRVVRHAVTGFMFSAEAVADAWRAAGGIGRAQPVFPVMETSSPFAPRPYAASREATGVHGDPAVLWVGRLHPRKSPLLGLDAFDRARARLRDPHLFMVYGEDHLLRDVQRFCADRPGLAERVHLIGRVPHVELAAWFSAADLFLTSSPAEGSNFALIESLSCGLLPVCSDNPANRAVTRDGEAGLLFPYGDAARGADAIVEASAIASREGEEGRRRRRAYFERYLSWQAIAEQAAAAYRAAVVMRRGVARLAR